MPGAHNLSNALAALAATLPLEIAPPTCCARRCATTAGLEHRLETVATIDGVALRQRLQGDQRWLARGRAARASTTPVVLIAGGRDKGQDFAPLRAAGRGARRAPGADRRGRRDASRAAWTGVPAERAADARRRGAPGATPARARRRRARCCCRRAAPRSTCSATTRTAAAASRPRSRGSKLRWRRTRVKPRRPLAAGRCRWRSRRSALIMVYSSSAILGITRYQDPNHFLFKPAGARRGSGVVALLACARIDLAPARAHRRRGSLGVAVAAARGARCRAGTSSNGARRWLRLGFFTFQPTDLARLADRRVPRVVAQAPPAGEPGFARGVLPPLGDRRRASAGSSCCSPT